MQSLGMEENCIPLQQINKEKLITALRIDENQYGVISSKLKKHVSKLKLDAERSTEIALQILDSPLQKTTKDEFANALLINQRVYCTM